jgi:predicted enzyme related to lactoylglutathione lyase
VTIELLVNIDVDDLAKAEAFYRDALGLRIGRRFGSEAVELLGACSPIYLLEKPSGSKASPATMDVRTYSRHWTPVHLDFAVEDISAAVERAHAAGGTLEGEVRTHSWGHIAMMADPFGHGFCLVEFRGRGYDEIADPRVHDKNGA